MSERVIAIDYASFHTSICEILIPHLRTFYKKAGGAEADI